MKIIISGGGTGGHIFPAIAIADAVKKRKPEAEILFVGAKGKMEMERVPKAGYPIEGLWISGFQRKLTLQNLAFPFKLVSSLLKARSVLKSFKPDVVIGVGGFASGPTLRMATKLGIPTLIQEQNSYPGITNRLLAAKADKICVAYPGMEKFFPKEKITLTGNPVRQDLADVTDKKTEAAAHFGFDIDKKTIVLMGGSLGARRLNEAMRENFKLLQKRTDVQVLWQAGKLYVDEFSKCETAQLPDVKITAFLEKMDLAYALADVLICRAGALTISELCIVGKPAILVPSPNVAEDHQTKNAKALAENEAAFLVEDGEAAEEMIPLALRILQNQALAGKLSGNIKKMAKPGAAENIVNEIFSLVEKRKRIQ